MKEREQNFIDYVTNQAMDFLNEIKNTTTTFGDIEKEILKCEQSIKWSNPNSYYLSVVAEAKVQLKKEIDATTHM